MLCVRRGERHHLRNLLHPGRDALEGVAVSDIIYKQNTLRTSDVGGGDGAEALLTSGIPNLVREEESARATWSFTVLPHTFTVLILKSMPMVVMKVLMKFLGAYCISRQVLPTPTRG